MFAKGTKVKFVGATKAYPNGFTGTVLEGNAVVTNVKIGEDTLGRSIWQSVPTVSLEEVPVDPNLDAKVQAMLDRLAGRKSPAEQAARDRLDRVAERLAAALGVDPEDVPTDPRQNAVYVNVGVLERMLDALGADWIIGEYDA